jgi:hypothetical protein
VILVLRVTSRTLYLQQFRAILDCISSISPRARRCTKSTTATCYAVRRSGTPCIRRSCGRNWYIFCANPTETVLQSGGVSIGKAHGLSVIADIQTVHTSVTRRASGGLCGFRARGDERQALGTFTSQLVEYAHRASEAHEQMLIEQGHPNEFVLNPKQHKKEWDALQALHPKAAMTTVPVSGGLSLADTEAFCDLMLYIYCMGLLEDQHISRFSGFMRESWKSILLQAERRRISSAGSARACSTIWSCSPTNFILQ